MGGNDAESGRSLVSRPRSSRSTLGSVADRAGVSRQTVSNVINTPGIVAADTAAKVKAAIDELGYRPHRAARQLRTRRSQILALRVEQSNRIGVLDHFLHALTDAATALDHRVMLYTAVDDGEEIGAFDELIERWDIDGFILTDTHRGDSRPDHLAAAGVPYVSFGRPWDPAGHHPWVDVDGAAGTRSATEHLIANGHRRIAFLGWPEGSGVGDDRLSGWRSVMAANDLAVDRIARCHNDLTEGRRATASVLDGPAGDGSTGEAPTALVCVSDALALGAMAELAARGLRPGADIAVIGFDDTDVAEVVGLTSLAQPLAEVAAHCVRMLLDQVAGHPSPPPPLLVPRLVVRDSG